MITIGQAFREKYTLSKTIGRGACGEVKLAFEKDSCQKFAVKVISKKTFSMGVSELLANQKTAAHKQNTVGHFTIGSIVWDKCATVNMEYFTETLVSCNDSGVQIYFYIKIYAAYTNVLYTIKNLLY